MKRTAASGKAAAHVRYNATRRQWALTDQVEVIVHRYDTDTDPDQTNRQRAYDDIPEVLLVFRRPASKQKFTVDLTAMTREELNVFYQVVAHAVGYAIEPVIQLDVRAQKEFNEGDDSQPRLYRRLPELHDRDRSSREHSEQLRQGPDPSP